MINIETSTIAQTWRETIKKLYAEGRVIENDEIFRDETVCIEIEDVTQDLFDNRFPMSKEQVDVINNYFLTGANEDKVTHDWTKIYRKRLFDSEPNQIQNVIDYLKAKPAGKRGQASIWKQEIDLLGPIAPCLQLLWFQIVDKKLDIHVHMRASDCYGKLLMNMNEFSALQRYMAEELSVKPGKYIHFIDTCHFNSSDEQKVSELVKSI